jgi:hypothetical protein
MERNSSFGNAERHLAIVSGGTYPELGILERLRDVRSLEDERSHGKEGNEIENKLRCRRHGADPFKNVSGRRNSS